MIAPFRAHRSPAAVCLLLGLLAAPLTNEDVVRLVIHGTPEKTILREMEGRPVEFDLAPGVVEELARVGVSPAIIEAMRRRQGAMPRRCEAPPPPAGDPVPMAGATPGAPVVPAPSGRLMLVFDAGPAGEDRPPDPILAITALPKGAPRPDDAEIGTVTDLALAILCTSADHVPDHWDSRTPLQGAPRHEVLLFRPGGSPARQKGFDVIALSREPAGPIALPAGSHALLVALAGKQTGSGAWRLLASDAIRVDIPPGASARLVLDARSALTGTRMLGFHLAQVWSLRQEPEASPAGAPR